MTLAPRAKVPARQARGRAARLAGRRGEVLAALLLMAKGYRILGFRLKTPHGEIDLLAQRGRVLAVIEVKRRMSLDEARNAVSAGQLERLRRAGRALAQRRAGLKNCVVRLDLIALAKGPGRVILLTHGDRTIRAKLGGRLTEEAARRRPAGGWMTREQAEAVLSDAGAAGESEFPLFEAAIACAIHEDPARDPAPVRALMEQMAERLRARMECESPEEALAETMCGDFRFAGDLMTFDDPANADVLDVAARRKGIPVALGVFYLETAARAGMGVQGWISPGHFLLRVDTPEGPLALDPFSEGRVVLPSELTRRALRAGLTPDVADRLDLLMAPVKARSVLIRLQNNIFARAQSRRDYASAERSALRRALLDPADHRPWIDVAAAREGQGALAGALEALNRAQQLDGGAAIAARAARERVRMRLN